MKWFYCPLYSIISYISLVLGVSPLGPGSPRTVRSGHRLPAWGKPCRVCVCRSTCALLISFPASFSFLILVMIFKTESMVEIYSKSLVRAVGKALLMKFS